MEAQILQFFALLLLVPLLFLDRRLGGTPDPDGADELGTNLTLGAIMLLSDAAILAVFGSIYAGLRPHVMLVPEAPFVAQLAIALVLGDLASYWYHRFLHRVRWLWASHIVHHQSRRIELSTGIRNHPFATIGTCLFWAPLLVIGISLPAMLLAAGLIGTWVILIHCSETKWSAALPRPVAFVLNLPSHHRMHHRQDRRAGDCNYGLLFILWDHLFGTYRAPHKAGQSYGVPGAAATGAIRRLLWQEWRETMGLAPSAGAAAAGTPASIPLGITVYLGAAIVLALATSAGRALGS